MEKWKEISNHKNYSISSYGRVRNDTTGTIRKPQVYTNGYYSVRLNYKNKLIHRLVAEAFIQNKENKEFVDHIDGNRKNNNFENLRWVSARENLMGYGHEERSDFHKIGIKAYNVKTKEEIYFKSKTECADYFKCDKSKIKTNYLYKQRNKKNWIFYITKEHKTKKI